MHSVETLTTLQQCTEVAGAWAALARAQAHTIDGTDFTGTLEWTLSLWENHLHSEPQNVMVFRDGDEVRGILPCHVHVMKSYGVEERVLEPITQLYAGRTGFLARDVQRDVPLMLGHVYENITGWDTFRCTLVAGGSSEHALQQTCAQSGRNMRVLADMTSPYIEMPDEWEEYVGSLSKNFRDNLKKSERRLDKAGRWGVRFYTSTDDVPAFLDAVLRIERLSWKEAAGSSITTNPIQEGLYRRLLPRLAERGWLLGTVLTLDDAPIAYTMGCIFEGIYYNEKASYDESNRATGAGSFIYLPLLKELHGRGIRIFDWMGKCEEFKLRWTDRTYTRRTYVLYNTSIRASIVRAKHGVAETIARSKGNAGTPVDDAA